MLVVKNAFCLTFISCEGPLKGFEIPSLLLRTESKNNPLNLMACGISQGQLLNFVHCCVITFIIWLQDSLPILAPDTLLITPFFVGVQ